MRFGMCNVPVAPMWSQPNDSRPEHVISELLFEEPLQVIHQEGDWIFIRAAHYSQPGWVRVRSVYFTKKSTWERARALWLRPMPGTPLEEAWKFYGVPYKWGGMSRQGIDCAGLVHMAYRNLGILIPRDADEQEGIGELVDWDDLQPGDLITYGKAESPLRGRATHIAFVTKQLHHILHATKCGKADGVIEELESPALVNRRRCALRISHPHCIGP